VKRAQMLNDLNMKIATMDDEIDHLNKVLEQKEEEVKVLVAQKKKTQAMTKLQEVKAKRELVNKKEMIKTQLMKVKMQIELQSDNVAMFQTLKGVNQYLGDTQKINEQVTEEIETFKEMQMEMKQNDDYLKQLMAPDMQEKQELEDEYAQYEKELQQQEADKVAARFDKLPATTAPATHQQVAQPQVNYQQNNFESKMADILKM